MLQSSSSAHSSSIPSHIPPELRGYIGRFCDRQSLARLGSVDRLWAAESGPLLYHTVPLFLRYDTSAVVLRFVDCITGSPLRASWIRRLILEKRAGYGNHVPPGLLDAVARMLENLPDLTDLRLHGHDLEFQDELLWPVASYKRRFRLHTLYLSQQIVLSRPYLFEALLHTHAASLRILAIEAYSPARTLSSADTADPRYIWHAATGNGYQTDVQNSLKLLRADCTRFAFARTPKNVALSLYAASVSKVSFAAQSLAVDPCFRLPDAVVETLQVDCEEEPRAGVFQAFSAKFPHIKTLELLISSADMSAVDSSAVAEAVRPFPLLEVLCFMGYRHTQTLIPLDLRKQWIDMLISIRCFTLREVKFPDGSLARRDDEGDGQGVWYDAVNGTRYD